MICFGFTLPYVFVEGRALEAYSKAQVQVGIYFSRVGLVWRSSGGGSCRILLRWYHHHPMNAMYKESGSKGKIQPNQSTYANAATESRYAIHAMVGSSSSSYSPSLCDIRAVEEFFGIDIHDGTIAPHFHSHCFLLCIDCAWWDMER